jgi:asparagine synthase (glutamine-hydrolysing)
MCGIAGLLNHDVHQPVDVPALVSLQEALRHRGPDGRGRWSAGPVGLAHTRLALVDLTTGDQPLANESGQLQLVFNGEVYNHRELRAALQRRGHRFRSGSDAEVVVHLVEERGVEALQALDGPFALALWDTGRRELLLACDRFGMRPLHWLERHDGWAFASEVKALLALPDTPRQLDPVALAQTAHLWGPVAPRSAFAGVHTLGPGEWLRLRPAVPGQPAPAPQRQRWWQWPARLSDTPQPDTDGFDAAADALRERLRASTQRQLDADVPVGVYLSGGLDSAVLAALAAEDARRRGTPLQAFALGFDDPAVDESPAQDAVAAALGLQLNRVRVDRQAHAADLDRLVWHAETPVVRTAAAPLFALARLARQSGVKAVLSGEGADELLGGYDLFKELRIRRLMAGGRAAWRAAPLSRLYPYLAHRPGRVTPLAARWWATTRDDLDDPLLPLRTRLQGGQRFASLLAPPWRQAWPLEQALAGLHDRLPPDPDHRSWLARAQLLEITGLLPGYLLSTQGDRVAMAEGLELRHPYLDHGTAEWLATLPDTWKQRGLRDKRLLRAAARPLLPAALRERPKQPFRAPGLDHLLDTRGRLPDAVEARLTPARLRDHSWLDATAVNQLLTKARAGRATSHADNLALVMLVTTLSWLDQFGAAGPAPVP